MAGEDWSTRDGLRAIAVTRAARIDGWVAPVAYAVGYQQGGEWTFPHVNPPGPVHGIPAVVLAEVVGYANGTRAFEVSADQLDKAIAGLAPAEAAVDLKHPNLAAWRHVVAAPRDAIAVVFVGSLDDAPAGSADAALRAVLTTFEAADP